MSNARSLLDEESIRIFREYLRIPSVHPNINYELCVEFLKKQAQDIGLVCEIYNAVEGKPIVIMKWLGNQPELPGVMLNGHMDVVPVDEEKWTHKPFDAEIDEQGNIYARGAQDMKSVSIQYLEAIRRLKKDGVHLTRTVYVTFVPDEEVGGEYGMGKFVESEYFRNLNIGVALDEGLASPATREFMLFFGERSSWTFHIHCTGVAGHGASLPDNTAAKKMQYVLNKLLNFREAEKERLKDDPNLGPADIMNVNLTLLRGGHQSNIIPSELVITFDCRVPVTVNHEEWASTLEKWCKEAGDGVWIEYKLKQPPVPITKLDDSNPFWIALKRATDELGVKLKPVICPGGTDAKYIRRAGLPAFGFSPMDKTPILLHGHNEYLNSDIFLEGIQIYIKIIKGLASTK